MGNGRDRVLWRTLEVAMAPWRRGRLYVRALGTPARIANDRPVLLVANHVSWWDGFLLRDVQRAIRPRGTLCAVALEREVTTHLALRMMGCIGMDPGSPASILRAVRAVAARRGAPHDTVFAYFPQGRIAPSFARPLAFRRGIDVFVRAIAPVTVLPVALHIEPMARAAPTAFVSVGDPLDSERDAIDHAILECEVAHLIDSLLTSLASGGEDALPE